MTWSALDASLWNLAVPAGLLVAGCGARVILETGETDGAATAPTFPTITGETTSDPTTATTPTTVTETASTTVGPGECIDANDCPYGYVCIDYVCVFDGYCEDECCYDGCWYDYCFQHEDCYGGAACLYEYCEYVGTTSDCLIPDIGVPIPLLSPNDDSVLSLTFAERPGTRDLVATTAGEVRSYPFPFVGVPPTSVALGPAANAQDVVAGDFDLDGDDDLVVASATAIPSMRVLVGAGDGSFVEGQIWESLALDLAVGEFDGTAGLDVLGVHEGARRLFTLTAGAITQERQLGGVDPGWLAGGRIAGAANDDAIVHDDGRTRILLGGSTFGQSEVAVPEAIGAYQRRLVALDYDGDGDDEIIGVTEIGDSSLITTWRNDAGVTIQPPRYRAVPNTYRLVDAADVDGDGVDELVLGRGGAIAIVRFAEGEPYSWCETPIDGAINAIATGNADTDTDDEVVVAASSVVYVVAF